MDTAPLYDAYRALLDAATTVAEADRAPVPPPDERDATKQLLALLA